jgi:hypothetical protein
VLYVYGPADMFVEQINTSSGTYEAYGNQTGHTGTWTTPLGYDGQYINTDTGLIYMRARI